MNGTMDVLKELTGEGRDEVSAEMLGRLRDGVSTINRNSSKYWALRVTADDTRFQRWVGQSPDGKQRAELMGTQPFPFDGASDARVNWADTLISEKVRMLMVALWRASVSVLPHGRHKSDETWRSGQILQWFARKMGWWGWNREWIRVANYVWNDSPAVALMQAEWRRTREIELKRLTVEELAGLYVRLNAERGEVSEEDLQVYARRFEEAMLAPQAGEDELAGTIGEYFEVTEARAKRAARELREKGEAEFPVPGAWQERVELRALRFMDDFYLLDGTRDFENCQLYYTVRWMDKVELEDRVTSEGWNKEWVEEVLQHEGESCFDEYAMGGGGTVEQVSKDLRTGLYQVVTAHFRAANEDGIQAQYACAFSTHVEGKTAYGRKLETMCKARAISAETVDQWLLNARGIPNRVGPAAGIMKGLLDDLNDSARMQLLPPVVGDGYGTNKEENLPLEPLGYIPLKRGGKLGYLGGMNYPAHLIESLKMMRDERDEMFARPNDNVVPRVVSDMAQEFEVKCWLGFAQDVYGMVMELIRDNVSDDELREMTDTRGQEVAPKGREMLARGYAVQMTFDPQSLDEDRMIKRVSALTQIKQSDAQNVLDMAPVIKAATRALLPHFAEEALNTQNEGQQGEWQDEERNYLKIRAGVMPQMVTDGTWNYDLRLGWYEELMRNNPAATDDMGEDKLAMLEQWLNALAFQAEQYGANREIGKTGVAGVA